jgi:hypothetical protein
VRVNEIAWRRATSPPSDTTFGTRGRHGRDGDQSLGRLVHQPQPEFVVELALGAGFGVTEDDGHVAEAFDHAAHLVDAELVRRCYEQRLLSTEALALHLSHPGRHDGRVSAGLERRPVARKAPVAVLDLPPRRLERGFVDFAGIGRGCELGAHCVEVLGIEEPSEPSIERGDDLVLAQVHGAWVVEVVGERVLAWYRQR